MALHGIDAIACHSDNVGRSIRTVELHAARTSQHQGAHRQLSSPTLIQRTDPKGPPAQPSPYLSGVMALQGLCSRPGPPFLKFIQTSVVNDRARELEWKLTKRDREKEALQTWRAVSARREIGAQEADRERDRAPAATHTAVRVLPRSDGRRATRGRS